MFTRIQTLSQKQNLFVFGPRGVGKSTLLRTLFLTNSCLYLDLLNPEIEDRLIKNPSDLISMVKALPNETTHIVIDEIQKVPKLLDVVHLLIEQKQKLFVMSGSSARKLKGGAANLLAGRAIVYNLYPLSVFELEGKFCISQALRFGTLPKLYELDDEKEKQQYLMSYTHTYLKEEIKGEQLVRNLEPFRRFLEVAAQCNGKIINFANIARDVGTSENNVKEYFSILEDTLLGFFLEPFIHSFRKRLSHKPKFYLFDTGIVRSLTNMLNLT
ncbi:MAG: AAA family ATPase, partial [Gammaproteobacteria bacterium]|nr:AAA family ATPase [Gammaproteobacteria bacterium]